MPAASRFCQHNMLHFVLAMMTPSVAATLFTDTVLVSDFRRYSNEVSEQPCQDIKLLAKAKAMKSFTVYQDTRAASCRIVPRGPGAYDLEISLCLSK